MSLHSVIPVDTVLSLRDIEVTYRTRRQLHRVLRGVSLDVARAETLGLVGESAGGKSSLARVALALQAPSKGQVFYGETDFTKLSAADRRGFMRQARVQAVFQDPFGSLNPSRPIGQSISEPLLWHPSRLTGAQRAARAREMLELVGLGETSYGRYPGSFSGGQLQRIAIARALIARPQLVVCDEAVSALDLSVQAQVLNLLADLQRQFGVSYLFISHDLSVVRFFADRIAVLDRGRIVEQGPAEQVWSRPHDPYTRRLIAAVPRSCPTEESTPSPLALSQAAPPDEDVSVGGRE